MVGKMIFPNPPREKYNGFTKPVDWLKTPSNGVKNHLLKLKTFPASHMKHQPWPENSCVVGEKDFKPKQKKREGKEKGKKGKGKEGKRERKGGKGRK